MSFHGGAVADASPYLGSIFPVVMPELTPPRAGFIGPRILSAWYPVVKRVPRWLPCRDVDEIRGVAASRDLAFWPSSSGKTSLAKELQRRLRVPAVLVEADRAFS